MLAVELIVIMFIYYYDNQYLSINEAHFPFGFCLLNVTTSKYLLSIT
jgi:cytochrome b561